MKKVTCSMVLLGVALSLTSPAHARDTKYLLPIEPALAVKDAQNKLDGSVKFFLAIKKPQKFSPS